MRLLRRLRSEEGITLLMAIIVLGVLSLSGASLVYYSSTNERSARLSKSSGTAYSLAEAGIAQALSVLNNALNPMTGSLLEPTTVELEGGSVTYSGTLAGEVWTISATGTVANPTGAEPVTRTLTRSAQVYGLNTGATVGAWSRWYVDSTTTCLTIEDVVITMPIAARGDLCLRGSAQVAGSETTLEVGGNVTMTRGTSSSERSAGAGSGWTSSGNIVSSNNAKASTNVPGDGLSPNLSATGFGFSIPSSATIVGIRVEIERDASSWGNIGDEDVYILKGGSAVGTDHAEWGDWGTWDDVESYGGSSDLWGTTWTPANVNASNFGVRLRVNNDSSSTRTAYVDHVEITVYYQPPPTTTIGTVAAPIKGAHIAGTCTYDTQPAHTPCTDVDKVWATTIDTAPQNLSKPAVDMAYWYTNAKPGPLNGCTVGSFPGGFDDDTSYNNSRSGSAEVTPEGSSYTCRVEDAQGYVLGEISWDHVTHVLKIKGTIFVDGDFRFDDDGQIVHYQGRGIIYAAGDIEFDELVCAGGSGTESCVDTGMANWDPTQNMMIVLAGDDAEYDQGGTQDAEDPSGLQGLIYANDDCTVHENFHTSGPIVCDKLLLPSEPNGWPTYYSWPPLGTLIAGQAYGDPNGASDFAVVPGTQSG